MAFLGSFLLGQTVTFRITWTPDIGQPAITGSDLTIRHDDGTIIGPLAGVSDGANAYHAVAEPTKKGRWHVAWETAPDGGVTADEIYIS